MAFVPITTATTEMQWKYHTNDVDEINRLRAEEYAKEQGVQPTPSSATQETYLNPSYGNVTQTGFRAPLQKSQNQGATTPKTPVKVDPVRAMLDKTGKKPTLPTDKTLEQNLQEAAAQAKQPEIGVPASIPRTIEDQQAERKQIEDKKLLMQQTQGTGITAANIADPEVLYPAGKPLDPAIVQQGIKDNTLHIDEMGGLHRANKGKWEPYPIAHSQKDGSFKPVELNSWTNAGGMAMHGTSSMYVPPTGVAKNSFNRQTTKAETFATGLLGTGARYFTGKSPDYPLGQQTIGQQGEMVGDFATSIFAGTTFGGYFKEASPVIRGIIQASVQNGVDFVQVENMVNKGYIDASQAVPLAAIYGVGNLASPFIGRYILKTAKDNPVIKGYIGEQVANVASVGGATYKMIKDNGGTDQQAAVESAKVAGLTIAAGMGFNGIVHLPGFISKYLPTFQNRAKWILENNADMDGVSAIPFKPTGDVELDSKLAEVPKSNGNIIISNRDIVDIAQKAPVYAKTAVERIAETVKAGNPPEPTAVETKPDVPAVQEMVTKINVEGVKPEGKLAKEWVAGFKDTDLSPVKEGETPKAKDTKAKIEFAHQAQLAATQIFGEKVPIVKVFDMLNTDNLPISATIKDGFDGSVHDKIINGEAVSKADELVGQVELKNVTDDVLNRVKTVYPDNWLEKTIGMYSIAGSKKIEDALFDFYKNDTFADPTGKAVPATLQNIEIDADTKMRIAANNTIEMASVENTRSPLIATQQRNAEFTDQAGMTPQEIVEYKLENRQKLTPEELRIANSESYLPEGYKYDRNTNLQPTTSNMTITAKPEALPTDNSAVPAPEVKAEIGKRSTLKTIESNLDDAMRQKRNLDDDLEELNQDRLSIEDGEAKDAIFTQMDDIENKIWQTENKIKELETDYDETFTNTVKQSIKDAGAKIEKHSYASTGTQYYECSYTDKITDETIDFTIRVANHSQVYEADINIDYGLNSQNIDGDNVLNLTSRIEKFVDKNITPPPPSDEQLDAIAIAEVAKTEPKIKKGKPKNPKYTQEEYDIWHNSDTPTIKKWIEQKYNLLAEWKKLSNTLDEEDVVPYAEWADNRASEIFNDLSLTMSNGGQTLASAGLITLGTILDATEDDSDDTQEAGISGGTFLIGLGIAGMGGLMLNSRLKRLQMKNKLGVDFRDANQPSSIERSRVAYHPEDFGYKTEDAAITDAREWNIYQNSIMMGQGGFQSPSAIRTIGDQKLRDFPNRFKFTLDPTKLTPPDPRNIWEAKYQADLAIKPYEENYKRAERVWRNKAESVTGLPADKTTAIITNTNKEILRRTRAISFNRPSYLLPESEWTYPILEDGTTSTVPVKEIFGKKAIQRHIDNLHKPESINSIILQQAGLIPDVPKLASWQVEELRRINPFFVGFQNAAHKAKIESESRSIIGVSQDDFAKHTIDLKQKIATQKLKNDELSQNISTTSALLDSGVDANGVELDDSYMMNLRRDLRLYRGQLRNGITDMKGYKLDLSNLKKLDNLGKTFYMDIVGNAKKGNTWLFVLNEMQLDESGIPVRKPKYGIPNQPEVDEPLKEVFYHNNELDGSMQFDKILHDRGWKRSARITGVWEGTNSKGEPSLFQVTPVDLAEVGNKLIANRTRAMQILNSILTKAGATSNPDYIKEAISLKKDMEQDMENFWAMSGDDISEDAVNDASQTIADLSHLLATGDDARYAERQLQSIIMSNLTPSILNYRNGNFMPVYTKPMTSKAITDAMYESTSLMVDGAMNGYASSMINKEMLLQKSTQNLLGINNKYTKYLNYQIASTLTARMRGMETGQIEVGNTTFDIGKVSQIAMAYTAFKYLFNVLNPLRNLLFGLIGQTLNINAMGGSIFSHAKELGSNSLFAVGKGVATTASNLSISNTKPKAMPLFAPVTGNPDISAHELKLRAWDGVYHTSAYDEDITGSAELTGVTERATRFTMFSMAVGERLIRSNAAAMGSDYYFKNVPFENSGMATKQDWINEGIKMGVLAAENSQGLYNRNSISPFLQRIQDNKIGKNWLLFMKPAFTQSALWMEFFRKPLTDLRLAQGGKEKTKILLFETGRALTTLATATAIGGMKAVPFVGTIAGGLAGYELFNNGGKWSATTTTALEKTEEWSKKQAMDAGVSPAVWDKFYTSVKYGTFSMLTGLNFMADESWDSYFTPVTAREVTNFIKDFDKAGKEGDLFKAIGVATFNLFQPSLAKRTSHVAMEMDNKSRIDPKSSILTGAKLIEGDLTVGHLIRGFIGLKDITEITNDNIGYDYSIPVNTLDGQEKLIKDVLASPGLVIPQNGILKGAVVGGLTQRPELLAYAPELKEKLKEKDDVYTKPTQASMAAMDKYIDDSVNEENIKTAGKGYGRETAEKIETYKKQMKKWCAEYYQGRAAYDALQEVPDKVLGFSPSSIKFEESDAVASAPEQLKGFEYAKEKVNKRVKRVLDPALKGSKGGSMFDSNGELKDTEPKEYEYKEPQYNE